MTTCKCISTGTFPETLLRGDTVHWTFTFTDNCDDPIDISGWEIWVILKSSSDDTTPAMVVRRDVGSTEDTLIGKAVATITSEESSALTAGKYYYEFKRVLTGTTPFDVWTFHYSESSSDRITVKDGTYVHNLIP